MLTSTTPALTRIKAIKTVSSSVSLRIQPPNNTPNNGDRKLKEAMSEAGYTDSTQNQRRKPKQTITSTWTVNNMYATHMQKDRVFIMGDAAHRHPPSNGLGSNTSIQDGFNLAWKLALALQGNPTPLATYQREREANVRQFIDLSMALGRLINQTDPEHLPKGRMKSIWPDLGPGLGPRDGVAGALVPQGLTDAGRDADDAGFPGFHILSDTDLPDAPLPVFRDGTGWLADRGLAAALVRPDGYALAGIKAPADLRHALSYLP